MNSNLDKSELLKKYSELTHIEMVIGLTKEVTELNAIWNSKKEHSYSFKEYRKYAGELLFFLNTFIKPSTLRHEEFSFFKPILESLVAQKTLKQSDLDNMLKPQ